VETDGSGVSFLEHRGFREVWRHIPARLNLGSPRSDVAPDVPPGFRLTTLASELSSGGAVLPALYDLAVRTNADQPQLDPTTPPPLEQFTQDVTVEPRAIPEAFFLAYDGARLVGLSSLERLPGTNEGVETGYTAVDSEYRGRGIARALKLRTIEWASDQGYRYIETDTNAGNEPMIGLNRSLGFEAEPARITYELVLSADGTVAESDSRSG
jgi:RimJ/RimL family protein N-acetyltransferase